MPRAYRRRNVPPTLADCAVEEVLREKMGWDDDVIREFWFMIQRHAEKKYNERQRLYAKPPADKQKDRV